MLAPLVQVVLRAMQGGEAALRLLLRPRSVELLANTLLLAAMVCACCLVLGIVVAAAVTRLRLPAPRLWLVSICLPLALPSFVAAFAWTATWPGVTGLVPLVVVLSLTSLPLVTVPTAAAFSIADHALADVARTLGRSPLRVFCTVTLPQVLPAALAGTLLVALYTVSDFGAPAILRYQTLTTGVHALFSGGGDRMSAAATSLPLVVIAVLCVLGERWWRRRTERAERGGASRRAGPRPARRSVIVAVTAGLSLLAVVSVALPLTALVVRAVRAERFGADLHELWSAAATTLLLAVAAASVTVLLALPVAALAARHPGRLAALAETAVFLGHGIPGVVLALALVGLSLTAAPHLYQTTALLVLGYAMLQSALAVGSARSALSRVPIPALEVSRTLGRGRLQTWLRVSLPGAFPGVAAGWLLVAAAVMKELPATLMLRPIGLDTLATELWSTTSIGAYGAAAPIGILLVAAGAVPALLLASGLRRSLRA